MNWNRPSSHPLSDDQASAFLRRMWEIRAFEEATQRLFTSGLVRGSTHLCQGQEAVVVGACGALRDGDTMACTYRGHGAVLAMGAPPTGPSARSSARRTACAAARAARCTSPTSASARSARSRSSARTCRSPSAPRFAARYRGTDAVTLCFFGDGATNIGAFHEALNLASIWKLPVIFLCENNLYGEYSPLAPDDADRAARRPRRRLRDGARRASTATTSRVVHDAVDERGRARARRRRPDADRGAHLPPQGPLAHGPGDVPARRASWSAGSSATRSCCASDAAGARRRADAGRRRARRRPRPTIADALERARGVGRARTREAGWRTCLRMTERHLPRGVQRALADALDGRRASFLLGEDIGAAGGAFKVTEGLFERFGGERVLRHADLRAGDRRHRDRRRDARACGRSPRSCSPTSPPSASTRSPTSWRSTAT